MLEPRAQPRDRDAAMTRIELRVPYHEKDEAKRLGARWDAAARTWFVPDELDAGRFRRWLPPEPAPNVRAPDYFVAASTRGCWRCRSVGPVHGFILPAGHETLEIDDDDQATWQTAEEPTLLCYVDWLSPSVAAHIATLTSQYRVGYSRITDSSHWMNHCAHCGAQLGDHETYCEPGEGFLAFSLEEAQRISLAHVDAPFAGSCGSYSIGVTLIERMRLL
jgi:hypothetical protein